MTKHNIASSTEQTIEAFAQMFTKHGAGSLEVVKGCLELIADMAFEDGYQDPTLYDQNMNELDDQALAHWFGKNPLDGFPTIKRTVDTYTEYGEVAVSDQPMKSEVL